MALYYDAMSILSSTTDQGSLKSRIYGSTFAKSKPTQVYALILETSKRDGFLAEVIDNAQLLKNEPKLTPLLALFLCHDHFFAKSGVAAPKQHPLRAAIEKNKARLQSEFTRARLRRKCASVDALRAQLDQESTRRTKPHPRWARMNTVLTNETARPLLQALGWTQAACLEDILDVSRKPYSWCIDTHVPNLVAFAPGSDLTTASVYESGKLILQDKASCFPAYLLLGGQDKDQIGDIIDGCAAPGNKTTHLAAILNEVGSRSQIYACERDGRRSKTLDLMVEKAGCASRVTILSKQDFLAIDATSPRFAGVTHLLLDPSCSGSGILGREDIPKLVLPKNLHPSARELVLDRTDTRSPNPKKRKRGNEEDSKDHDPPLEQESVTAEAEAVVPATADRIQKLSNLQTRIVEHAMSFPSARRITYSTCSIHEQENEIVVTRLLSSVVAQERGWKLLPRQMQVEGMKTWNHRGVRDGKNVENQLNGQDLDTCIRCYPNDEEGTMGFFVCAFYREPLQNETSINQAQSQGTAAQTEEEPDSEDDAWDGFD